MKPTPSCGAIHSFPLGKDPGPGSAEPTPPGFWGRLGAHDLPQPSEHWAPVSGVLTRDGEMGVVGVEDGMGFLRCAQDEIWTSPTSLKCRIKRVRNCEMGIERLPRFSFIPRCLLKYTFLNYKYQLCRKHFLFLAAPVLFMC